MKMSKSFKNINPLTNLSVQESPEPVEATYSASHHEIAAKKKPGRPVTKNIKENYKTINVAMPIELLEKWKEVKRACGGNMTDYITKLVEKDMEANYEAYKEIINTLNNM